MTPLAEEVTDSKLIPRGMLLALGLLFISYALYTVAATNLVGIAALKNSPVPHMLLGQATLGEAGIIWMLVATLLTGVMTFNGGFATASRFHLCGCARGDAARLFRAAQRQTRGALGAGGWVGRHLGGGRRRH